MPDDQPRHANGSPGYRDENAPTSASPPPDGTPDYPTVAAGTEPVGDEGSPGSGTGGYRGFRSFEEFLEAREDEWRRERGYPPLEPVAGAKARARERGVQQVNLKLAPTDFESLADLAHQHGVAPTTMARIIVIRELRLGD